MLTRLWSETDGSIVSTELVLISSLLTAALVTSLTAMRDALTQEFADVTAVISSLDQGYTGPRDEEAEAIRLSQETGCMVVVCSALRD